MKHVYLVLKNSDDIEGRGPNIFHSVWNTWEDANKFVMDQPGTMGTKQYLMSLSDPEKGSWYYNGYNIHRIQFFEGPYNKNLKGV